MHVYVVSHQDEGVSARRRDRRHAGEPTAQSDGLGDAVIVAGQDVVVAAQARQLASLDCLRDLLRPVAQLQQFVAREDSLGREPSCVR